MLFHSYLFLFAFLPVTLAAYWALPRWRKVVLLGASYVFYAAWSVKFAGLMLATTSVDFFTARKIAAGKHRTAWLVVSMVSNLGVLAVFKYFDFFAGTVNALAPHALIPLIHLALPIGISFYTFESMSYTIDVYRGDVAALDHFVDYAHFVTMFPRLVAGPIVRYRDLAENLRSIRLDADIVPRAALLFTLGMAKKVLVADVLAAKIVDPAFAAIPTLSLVEAWSAALGYTAQLYFDFSGYSDMAVGLGLLFGIRLPRNFRLPYAAENVSEFWRRWHISLSSWLRDYLYISLGGNRRGALRTRVNLIVTMVLGGLWHGASWTFVAWGAFHGVALVLHASGVRLRVPRAMAIATTFAIVVVGWVIFRADHLGDAFAIYGAMLGRHGVGATYLRAHVGPLALLALALVASMTVDSPEIADREWATKTRWAIAAGAVLAVCLTRLALPSPFLYFQF